MSRLCLCLLSWATSYFPWDSFTLLSFIYVICSALSAFHLKFQKYFERSPRTNYGAAHSLGSALAISSVKRIQQLLLLLFHFDLHRTSCTRNTAALPDVAHGSVRYCGSMGSVVGSQLKMCSASSTNKSLQLNEAGPQWTNSTRVPYWMPASLTACSVRSRPPRHDSDQFSVRFCWNNGTTHTHIILTSESH